MAWEEESIESGAHFEEVGGRTSKIKMIVMALLAIGLLAGAWFGYQWWSNRPKTEDPKPTEEAATATGQEEVDEPEETALGYTVPMEKFTVNVTGGGTSHYLVTTIVLEVTTPELKAKMVDQEDTSLFRIKTRDAILSILRAKSYEEIRDADTSREVATEIRVHLNNKVLKSDPGKVRAVYFQDFVVD